jgi:hypothetical protein
MVTATFTLLSPLLLFSVCPSERSEEPASRSRSAQFLPLLKS